MQDLREGTSGVLRSDCIRPDGAISRRALRTIQDGKRLAVFGLRTPITVMQTFPRRGDPGRNSRDCRFALRAALAALASTVTPGARHRRRHLANRAGRSNARTAPAFWARSPRTSTRPLRRSARNARGVVGTDVAYPVDTARSGTQRPSGRPPNRPTGPNSPHIRSAHGCADLTRRASCQPATISSRVCGCLDDGGKERLQAEGRHSRAAVESASSAARAADSRVCCLPAVSAASCATGDSGAM